MSTIDITCSLPAPTLAQVRAWLTRTGWEVNAGPFGHVRNAERRSHPKHGSTWAPREELADWLAYVSCWIADRAWQTESTPEAVYREIVGAKVWRVEGYDCVWSAPEKAREVGARAYEIEVRT